MITAQCESMRRDDVTQKGQQCLQGEEGLAGQGLVVRLRGACGSRGDAVWEAFCGQSQHLIY